MIEKPPQILEILKEISEFLWSNTKKNGDLYCKRHGIEHTSKNAYAMIIDLKLFEITNQEKYFQRALKRAESIIYRHFGYEKGYNYVHFFPGTSNKRANIMNVIAGGSIIDGLCYLLKYEEKIDGKMSRRIKSIIKLHVSDYLVKSLEEGKIITSDLPNQRIWGATGVAATFKVSLGKEEWRKAVIKSQNKLRTVRLIMLQRIEGD